MRLSDLDIQETAIVTEILLDPKSTLRLQQLEIVTGQQLRLINTTLWQDPLLYQVGDTLIALRRSDANRIIVERVIPCVNINQESSMQ